MTIRSEQFDDIYFSPEDGAAESEYVFLKGNNLPSAWENKPYFSICETGYGTGLNFLLAWELFEKTSSADQHLHFISFEKYPLTFDRIREALMPWEVRFTDKLDQLEPYYPLLISGWHRISIAPYITLTLIFDDINNAAPELDTAINAWFLDGFAPSKNPEMWGDALFDCMKRCALQDTSIATFTAAGFVKRALQDRNFEVSKIPGFGRKREMITARYGGLEFKEPVRPRKQKSIAVIGGGLAGCSAAYHLKQAGHDVTLFEKESKIAQRASGNPLGLYNPKFRKQLDPEALFYSSAFSYARKLFKRLSDLHDIDFNPCGALHLVNSEQKQDRFSALLKNWRWTEAHMQWIDKENGKDISGIDLPCDALYLPDSGAVSPPKLCNALIEGIQVLAPIDDYSAYDHVIHASGAALEPLGLNTIRGQITEISKPDTLSSLKRVLCYGGYVTPCGEDGLLCGSTFQRWRDDEDLDPGDDVDNIQKLEDALNIKIDEPTIIGHRAALRTAAKDHFPVIGLSEDNHIYYSSAHGSHGLLSSLMGGIILSDLVSFGHVNALPKATIEKLSPNRL